MKDLYLTEDELCKKHKEVDRKVIEDCVRSGYNMHKTKINNKIIDALQKIPITKIHLYVYEVVSIVMSFADEEKTVWI